MKSLKIVLTAMMLVMTATTVYAATVTPSVNQPETYPHLDGIISQINDRQVVIGINGNNVVFALQLTADTPLLAFAPGDHVLARINPANNVVVAMFHIGQSNLDPRRSLSPAPPAPPAAQPVAAPKKQTTPAANRSGNPAASNDAAPIKQQNGVWTN